jgi:predicted Zn-dependent protease
MLPCIEKSLTSLRNDSISSESSLEIARLCLAANIADSARWFLNRVLRNEPDHPTCLFLMGQLYFNSGKNGLAREYLGRVLQRDRHHPEAHALLTRIDAAGSSPVARGE